jgi:hypothetical protein
MKPRAWIIAGMIMTTPCLLFTGLLAFGVIHTSMLATFGDEWWVENRTAEPIWVTPLGVGDRGPVLLPHYDTRLATYSTSPLGEVRVESGERRRLVIDGYVAADVGDFPGVVVRTAAEEHRYCKGTADGQTVQFLLDEQALLNKAGDKMIAVVHAPIRPVFFGIPFWLIIILGLAAPILLVGLRRTYRKVKLTP